MDPVGWVRELPNHMREALGSVHDLLSVAGARRVALAALLILTAGATAIGLADLVSATAGGRISALELLIVMLLAGCAIGVMWLALEFTITTRSNLTRAICFTVYFFFFLWSVGFGFGFYWKHLASVGQAQAELQSLRSGAVAPLSTALRSLDTVKSQIARVATYSEGKRTMEDQEGGSCEGVASGTGRGDLWRARDGMSDRVAALTGDLGVWIDGNDPTQTPTTQLRAVVQRINTVNDAAARGGNSQVESLRSNFEAVGADADAAIARVNDLIAGRKPYVDRLRQLSSAARNGIPTPAGTCRDTGLAETLDTAAASLESLSPIPKPDFQPKLGADATKDAFYRLWRTMGAILTAIIPVGPDVHLSARDHLGERDFVALVAAIVVDIGIAFLTLVGRDPDRLRYINAAFASRPRDRRLHRELTRFARTEPELLREIFDRSTILHEGAYYLIASEEIPEYYASIRNIQTVLAASGDATFVLGGPSGFGALRRLAWIAQAPDVLTPLIARKLAEIANTLIAESANPRRRGRSPGAFHMERVAVMRLTADLVFHLQRIFNFEAAAVADRADQGAAPTPGPHAAPPEPPTFDRRQAAAGGVFDDFRRTGRDRRPEDSPGDVPQGSQPRLRPARPGPAADAPADPPGGAFAEIRQTRRAAEPPTGAPEDVAPEPPPPPRRTRRPPPEPAAEAAPRAQRRRSPQRPDDGGDEPQS